MFITPTGFIVLVGLGLVGLWLFVELGSLPGKKAAERQHPQAEAINVLGWLGLLFGGVGWIAACVWAHMKPVFAPVAPAAAPDATTGEAAPPNGAAEEAS